MGMFTCKRDTESSRNDIAENNLFTFKLLAAEWNLVILTNKNWRSEML